MKKTSFIKNYLTSHLIVVFLGAAIIISACIILFTARQSFTFVKRTSSVASQNSNPDIYPKNISGKSNDYNNIQTEGNPSLNENVSESTSLGHTENLTSGSNDSNRTNSNAYQGAGSSGGGSGTSGSSGAGGGSGQNNANSTGNWLSSIYIEAYVVWLFDT